MTNTQDALADLKQSMEFRVKSLKDIAKNGVMGELTLLEIQELKGRIAELDILLKWISVRQMNLAAQSESQPEIASPKAHFDYHSTAKLELEFTPRTKRLECTGNDHDWLILCYKNDIAMAMCNNCACLEGGWVSYD